MTRPLDIAAFLDGSGWDVAVPTALAADFSPRRYARLTKADGQTAIMMDADADQNTGAFVGVALLLRGLGLSAPNILKANAPQGLVLMEDFGDRNIGRLIDAGIDAAPLHRRAVDVLAHMHKYFDVQNCALELPRFDAARFTAQAGLFLDHCAPEAGDADRAAFNDVWMQLLTPLEALPQSLLLRDFMPDNLMELPERAGVQSLGLLDFQDAGIGPIAYDLASLCEVVRRDGGDMLLDDIIAYYHRQAQPALSLAALRDACFILSAQRHLRILGILKKNGKAGLIPRVRRHLQNLLAQESLKSLSAVVASWL